MAHSLHRVLSSLYNRPHLITAEAFDPILTYLESRSQADFKLMEEDGQPASQVVEPLVKDGLGILSVEGSLTYRPVRTLCGDAGTSYQELVDTTQKMALTGAKTIVMHIDSPGGEAAHAFETADEIRSICTENNITLVGYAPLQMTSGAYVLGSICDVLVGNQSATIGSIGCVIALTDYSKMLSDKGVKRIFITSGANKVPYAEDGTFKPEFLASLQEDVDAINSQFANHVDKYRKLGVEKIKGLEAGTFSGDKVLSLGLIDAVMTDKQFATFVATVHKGNF